MNNNDKNDDMVKINKSNMKKIMIGGAIAGTLATGAVNGIMNLAKLVYERELGATYVVKLFNESGIVPRDFSSGFSANEAFLQYRDANNKLQILKGESAADLMDEILETTLANGYSSDWLAVYMDKANYRYPINFPNVDYISMGHVKDEAYQMYQNQNSKGVNR